ncbi:RHOMBOID-like protein 2 [Lactuca sativa]|uniref:RHOMBOID-like protein 2 n=1 Tax=Lactuca sativa TaxID=4236 RepID=UPI0022AF8834|nr:RHOMBOID-like protein 2 [Lactuca sativa]
MTFICSIFNNNNINKISSHTNQQQRIKIRVLNLGKPFLFSSLEKLGALQWRKIVHGNQGWRLVIANWLHAGLIHLVANMLSLVRIGICLEQQFGFLRVELIYMLSRFGGSALSSLFLQNNILVGASGALFGLLGTMLSELITNWTIYSNQLLHRKYSGNLLVNMLGKWKESEYSGQSVPVGGLAYYVTAPSR